MDFKVGDKVVRNYGKYKVNIGSISMGTVIRITPKRNDIVVDYGHYQETYNKDGYTKGSVWNMSFIKILTPEIEKEINDIKNDIKTIEKCKNIFENKSSKLTVDQAEKILEILNNMEEVV